LFEHAKLFLDLL